MSEAAKTDQESTFIGDLSVLDLQTEYRSLKEDPAKQFYRPCLLNANRYRRAVGFFRSTVYSVIGPATVEFARRGGKTQLICSPELTQEDIDSISLGYAQKSDVVKRGLIEQIDQLLSTDETNRNTRILATLISIGALEIKVAIRADRKGLYHEKIGLFSDGVGNTVSFRGSANETWSGWHLKGNFESIEVFCSWRGGLETQRVKKHAAHFDALWSESDPDIEVFSFPDAAKEHLQKASFRNLDAIESEGAAPPRPKARRPMPHQEKAVADWEARGGRGIFEHATGSGKTFTALLAIRKHAAEGNPTLVVVPSRLLLEQWALEIRAEIPGAALLLAGGGHNAWKASRRLKGMTTADPSYGGRIVLSTMQTASTPTFLGGVVSGPHLLLVADEVHQIGSPQHSRIMEIDAGRRLGLSATPVRYGDPDGTQRIFDYFSGIVPPPITLQDAIRAGRLVPYEHFPHPVHLSPDEADEWRRFTESISKEIARTRSDDRGDRPLTDRAKMLLIQRARVAKKASAKVGLACSVLTSHYQEGQHWLVYCEDADQLREVLQALKLHGLEPVEYHSQMRGDRTETLHWFRKFGGILVSIRCLDEGIDIPDVSHALILASSQNPRQFIQRRGRVLRRAPGKQVAAIHDAIVVPVNIHDEPEQVSLLRAELLRAIQFANSAINRGAAAELRDIAIRLGIDPEDFIDTGVEEEDA